MNQDVLNLPQKQIDYISVGFNAMFISKKGY